MCALVCKHASCPPLPGVPSARPEVLQERRFREKGAELGFQTRRHECPCKPGRVVQIADFKRLRARQGTGVTMSVLHGARSDRVDAGRDGWPQRLPGWATSTDMAAAADRPRCVWARGHVVQSPPWATGALLERKRHGVEPRAVPRLMRPQARCRTGCCPVGEAEPGRHPRRAWPAAPMRAGPPRARKQATRGRRRLRPVPCRWRAWARRRPATPGSPSGDARSRVQHRWRRCLRRRW